MALNVWTESSGFSFGVNYEKLKINIPLPVTDEVGVFYSLSGGELPGGLYIENASIVGTVAPLAKTQPTSVEYTFTIKARKDTDVSERSFTIVIVKNNIWTKQSGYNLCYTPNFGNRISANNIVEGYEYVICETGNSSFTSIGAESNAVGEVFIASGPTTGSGIVSECWLNERRSVNKVLPVDQSSYNGESPSFQLSVISGKLPPGLRIDGNKLLGTPFEVARKTTFTFCIRAQNLYQFVDRTFYIPLEGADPPQILTTGNIDGTLPVGTNDQYFVLSNSYVEYQIEAIDFDTPTGQSLNFFIAKNEGELPPGLILTKDGRIIGYVQPILSIKPDDGNGFYDIGYYDTVAYDWGYRPSNGYDSYLYDKVVFDYNLNSRGPRKLNRYYEFIVSVTDGDTVTKRKFKIFVVSDDYFSADNTLMLNGTGLFTADVTYMRTPLWVTPRDLGVYRANNYVTVIIDTYDTNNIVYRLELVNNDITATTKQFALTDNNVGSTGVTIINPSSIPTIGQYFTFDGKFNGGTERLFRITSVINLGNSQYRLVFDPSTPPLDTVIPDGVSFFIGTKSNLPPGMTFDVLSAEIFGSVPYQPTVSIPYNFSLTATRLDVTDEIAESTRQFTITIIGEFDSGLYWTSPTVLGSINANFTSTLSVTAASEVPNAIILYNKIAGSLPPGLSLSLDGEILGKVNQYQNGDLLGIITFDRELLNQTTTFDNGSTTFDYSYTFTVEARDQYGFNIIKKDFTIFVTILNQVLFSNIRTKPFLKLEQRELWNNFITNPDIFTSSSIYRPNDPNFGIHEDLSMIIYAGIETTEAAKYISAMGLNHKRKRFQFGQVKKSVAVEPGTNNKVYEVVYIEMVDPLEPNGKRLSNALKLNGLLSHNTDLNGNELQVNLEGKIPGKLSADSSNNIWDRINLNEESRVDRPNPMVTIDSTSNFVSDPLANRYFPNSITNWRERIKGWTDGDGVGLESERNYLPLWMRSIQPGTKKEIDFKLVVPICYCKVGTADDIILNIKFSDFDFKLIDYTVDRYIIDSVEGSTADKYLLFRNDRITV